MAEEFKNIIDTSFDKGITPFWIYTDDYIYGMIPKDASGSRWLEVSYTFEDPDEPLYKSERDADLSYQFLLGEELSKGVSGYVEDFKVISIKEFAKGLEGKSGSEKIQAITQELINNSANYAANFPIIKTKDELAKLKERL
ncbi:MAG: hypothetical protein JW891_13380 [Candidatus Lokiarchaeota archaeon]|nr:hypothetical protein [Candidatus Lokiarchaeota archaeon]